MSSPAERRFREELALLLQKNVTVNTSTGKIFRGALIGVEFDSLSICMSNATDEKNQTVPKLFLSGNTVLEIRGDKKSFDLKALAERLERLFPRLVRVVDEAGVIVVMDKIRVSENGILDGSGHAAERPGPIGSQTGPSLRPNPSRTCGFWHRALP